jgi:hypothetical protein
MTKEPKGVRHCYVVFIERNAKKCYGIMWATPEHERQWRNSIWPDEQSVKFGFGKEGDALLDALCDHNQKPDWLLAHGFTVGLASPKTWTKPRFFEAKGCMENLIGEQTASGAIEVFPER